MTLFIFLSNNFCQFWAADAPLHGFFYKKIIYVLVQQLPSLVKKQYSFYDVIICSVSSRWQISWSSQKQFSGRFVGV